MRIESKSPTSSMKTIVVTLALLIGGARLAYDEYWMYVLTLQVKADTAFIKTMDTRCETQGAVVLRSAGADLKEDRKAVSNDE